MYIHSCLDKFDVLLESDVYIKIIIDTLIPNIDLSNEYTKTEVDDIDNELSTLTRSKKPAIFCAWLFTLQ